MRFNFRNPKECWVFAQQSMCSQDAFKGKISEDIKLTVEFFSYSWDFFPAKSFKISATIQNNRQAGNQPADRVWEKLNEKWFDKERFDVFVLGGNLTATIKAKKSNQDFLLTLETKFGEKVIEIKTNSKSQNVSDQSQMNDFLLDFSLLLENVVNSSSSEIAKNQEEIIISCPPLKQEVKISETSSCSCGESFVEGLIIKDLQEILDDIALPQETLKEISFSISKAKNPNRFLKFGLNEPDRILFYGEPGTGKTTGARIYANETGKILICASVAEIMSKWHGESERRMKEIMQYPKNYPDKNYILFLDDVDVLAQNRDDAHEATQRVMQVILSCLDGMSTLNNLSFIAATNRKDALDIAFKRSCRINREIYFPLPDLLCREKIFHIHMRKYEKIAGRKLFSDFDCQELAKNAEHFSGAAIKKCVSQALEELAGDNNVSEDALVEIQTLNDVITSIKNKGTTF